MHVIYVSIPDCLYGRYQDFWNPIKQIARFMSPTDNKHFGPCRFYCLSNILSFLRFLGLLSKSTDLNLLYRYKMMNSLLLKDFQTKHITTIWLPLYLDLFDSFSIIDATQKRLRSMTNTNVRFIIAVFSAIRSYLNYCYINKTVIHFFNPVSEGYERTTSIRCRRKSNVLSTPSRFSLCTLTV